MAGLRRLDPQLAGLYELGLRLANEIEQPGYAHALAYVGREISRGVIRRRLQDEGIDEPRQAAAGCTVDRERNRPRIAAALQLQEDDPRVSQWLQMPARFAAWEKYRDGGPLPDDVREAFEQFSQMLFGLAAPYYATEAQLDALLDVVSPTAEDARRLRDLQLRPAQRRYFFERLKDPQWVTYLAHEGFFANPPGREVHEDGSWRPRWWPEGDYLIEVAASAPADVARVLLAIPSTNDNPGVWNSVARAASQLPADLAVGLVPAITSALEAVPRLTYWSDDVVVLIEYLAGSRYSEAFDLADYLLFIAGATSADSQDAVYAHNTEWLVPRIGAHDRQRLLDRVVAALDRLDPEDTLRLLLRKVGRVQSLVDTLKAGSGHPVASSVEWRLQGALDPDDEKRPETNIVTILGRTTVDAAQRLAKTGREEAVRVFALVKQREGRFFAGLRCHVLSAAGDSLPSQLDQFLLSDEARSPGSRATEVAALLRSQFRNASAPARSAYAAAVEVGPDRSELRARLEAWSQDTVTDADVERGVRRWQQRILTFFRGDIPEELHDLATRLGLEGVTPSFRDQQMAERGTYSEGGAGFVGRGERQNLAGWTVEEVAEFLRKGGAADFISLQEYAENQPADGVDLLVGSAAGSLAPGAVDGVLSGLAEAVKSGAQLDWPLVLRNLRQMFGRIATLEAPGVTVSAEWRGAVDYGVRLIRQGCTDDAIPAEHARDVWDALGEAAALGTVWSDPIRDHVTNLDGVLSAALNDAAGAIARAVIAAGLWHYRSCLQSGEASSEMEKAAARSLVEARLVPVLDALLDVSGPYRPVPRAVIGERLPWLYLLVPEWLDRSIDRLLHSGLEDPVTSPAWAAYILRNALYDTVFQTLRPWYLQAASHAETWKATLGRVAQRPEEVTKRLAGHLVTAFLRGLIRRRDDDRILEVAYANLSPSDWSYAYFRIFRAFREGDGPVPVAIIERLTELWEWRVSELSQQPGTEATAEEAKGLARFLSTPHIPVEAVVRLGPDTARLAEERVMVDWGELLELARSDPEGAFEIVDAVLRGTLRSRHGYVLVEKVKPLLDLILRTARVEVRDRARALVDHLGERGYRDFKDLLEDPRR
ncbi:MAG: hypothetical protein F4Y24_09585 [Gemmatimonadetes bacterium]|nr:hypothetical protein [Gemmatimonadota bacterium]MYG23687.1 hypothetical protein [Gemmatimonadota bacterium]MYJ39504.1 hypothetical protein [Gemmatimonadota bacterium]